MNLGNKRITKKSKMLLKIGCVLNAYLEITIHFRIIYLPAFLRNREIKKIDFTKVPTLRKF